MKKNHVMSVVFLIVIYFVFIVNIPLWFRFYDIFHEIDMVKTGFVLSIPVFIMALLNIIFTFFSFKYILKPIFILLFIVSSIVSYMAYHYHVLFDLNMIQNIFETNQGEAKSYLNFSIISWVFVMGVVPSIILCCIKIEYPSRWYYGFIQRFAMMAGSLGIILGIAVFYYENYASVGRNNPTLKYEIIPFSYLLNGGKYFYRHYLETPMPFMAVGDDAVRQANAQKPTLFFLVVGETARSANYALNGYGRDTNPFTGKMENMVAFSDISSCGTATAVSVPCMFSAMTRDDYNARKARNSEGLLDVLRKTGISVLWKENDGGCKGVCDRVPTIEIKPKDYPDFCNGSGCLDAVLLQDLDREITAMKGDKMVAFHIMGSHGPTYYQRYPEKDRFFTPDCARSDIENCTSEQLINTYDNTIRYTDFIISEMITKLKSYQDKYNVALIYLSDHGESLGEFGIYLHGLPYKMAPDYQKKVPMQIWFSDGFIKDKKIDLNCLRAQRSAAYSHDNLFSSMLGLWDIKTSVYDQNLDLFRQCRS